MKLMFSIIVFSVGFISSSKAEFYEINYENYSTTTLSILDEIVAARGLVGKYKTTAIQTAAAWHATGPCNIPNIKGAEQAIALVMNHNPKANLHVATLEMTAVLSAPSLGRKPTENSCKFAKEITER